MIDLNTINLLQAALAYEKRGFNILPVRQDKRPAVKWKPLQEIPADTKQLRKWFTRGKYPGLAVILGQSSGNLACRDFDEADGYHVWREHYADLANTLPTVQTARGFHVYFQNPNCRQVWKQADGELRGAGGICILPPSLHPDGVRYRWIIPLPDGELPFIDPWAKGLTVTEDAEDKEDIEENEVILSPSVAVDQTILDLNLYRDEIETVIAETFPNKPGTRDDYLFKLACGLKSIPDWWTIDPRQLQPVVKAWYQKAVPNIRTKSFETNWIEFLYKWQKVKYRKGQVMNTIMDEVKTQSIEGVTYDDPKLRELVAICQTLQQQAGENPFYLATSTAGELLDIDRMTAYRWLWFLEQDGWIRTIEKGNAHKATRFRFIGRSRSKPL
jgi:hypothetical protein